MSEGPGETSVVSRSKAAPPTSAPPPTQQRCSREERHGAAPAEPASRTGHRGRDRHDHVAQGTRCGLVLADFAAVPGSQPLFELVVRHRSVPCPSAGAIASRSRFKAWWSRDWTVPTGTPSRAAMSGTVRSR